MPATTLPATMPVSWELPVGGFDAGDEVGVADVDGPRPGRAVENEEAADAVAGGSPTWGL